MTIDDVIKYTLHLWKTKYGVHNMNEIIFFVEEDPEGGFNARSLGYSIFTEAENMEELKRNIRDAISCHFDEDMDIPKVVRLHFVREEIFNYA